MAPSVDDADPSVRSFRVEYDLERTASAIDAAAMPSAFAEMLRRGTS